MGDSPLYAASTTGFTSGAKSINLPLIMRGNYGFDTWFNVQNTGSSDVTVNVTYSNGATEPAATIKSGSAKTYNQTDNTGLTPTPWIGSATVTSNEPVVATVMQVGTGTSKMLLGYNGFAGNSTEIKLPLIMANNFGYYTGIQVMNLGAVPTTVIIAYSPNIAGSFAPVNDTTPCLTNLAPNQSCTVLQRKTPRGGTNGETMKMRPNATSARPPSLTITTIQWWP